MTKKILGLIMASCALSSTIGAVHEMRTPISLLSKLDNINGSFHYPLSRVKPVLFEDTSINFWSGAYYRSAFDGYCPQKCDSCCSCLQTCQPTGCNYNTFGGGTCGCNCGSLTSCNAGCGNGSICLANTNYIGCTSCPDNKVPLAQLIFGQASFYGKDAFWNRESHQGYDYLDTVLMSPKIDYKENGIVLGMHLERKVSGQDWRVGFNAALPIKAIEVTANYNCDSVYEKSVVTNIATTPGSAIVSLVTTNTGVAPFAGGPEVSVIQSITPATGNFITGVTGTPGTLSLLDYPEMFFNTKGVRLCDTDHIVGLGDLETALVVGYDFTERAYTEVVGGIKFPTSKRNTCPGRVYYMPTGNNGHFEAKIGLDGGYSSKKWVGIQADVAYTHVLKATEKKAAQFNCATIRGIGPCVDAQVKYGYFLGHLNLTVFHPENQDMGLVLGYEAYYKRQDKTCFSTCNGADRMEDFFGVVHPINPALVELNTDIMAHKIRGQVFTRWNYIELYAGASKVVGGWNGMAENEVHIGFDVNF